MSSRTVKKKTKTKMVRGRVPGAGDAYAAGWRNGVNFILRESLGSVLGTFFAIGHEHEVPRVIMCEWIEDFADSVRQHPEDFEAIMKAGISAATKVRREVDRPRARKNVQ